MTTVPTADTDVRIAVQIAQTFGVCAHLIGLEPSRVSQSPSLRQEVDTVHEIAKADVSRFLKLLTPAPPKPAVALGPAAVIETGPAVDGAVPKVSPSVGPAKTIDQVIDEAIQKTLAPPADVSALKAALAASTGVPMEYDRRLLGTCPNITPKGPNWQRNVER